MLGVTIGVLVLVWLERKISAAIQQRIGPEYTGPLGVVQALEDGIKKKLKKIFIGVFFLIAISSIVPIGLLMAGYGASNKYSFLGGLRAAAQSISYEIPLAFKCFIYSSPCDSF
ncbi:hypothetical protein MARPO_0167s0016, partial [Marchantia polymorpha]